MAGPPSVNIIVEGATAKNVADPVSVNIIVKGATAKNVVVACFVNMVLKEDIAHLAVQYNTNSNCCENV